MRNRVRQIRFLLAWQLVFAWQLLSSFAWAEEEPEDRKPEGAAASLPGSPRSVGMSVSPEGPPTPPAPGGRAPSFGAPADPEAWSFRLGGRFSAWGQAGLGHTPLGDPGEDGVRLHTPPVVVGRSPFYLGTAATLNFQYGNQTVMAFVSYEASITGREWEGYNQSGNGPRIRSAYVAVTPAPIGALRLRFQVGAFPAHYGAPGQWGWGIFGPVLAVHGYGGAAAADYNLSASTQLNFEYGVMGVPEVDEATVRGTYTDWPENGISTIVHHAHGGVTYKNKYFAKLHLAQATGRNMRLYLDDDFETPVVERGSDGQMNVAALELRTVQDPYGQFGITPVYWNFNNAVSVHDGIWWGLDWTAGGREMSNKFLGPQSEGTGEIFAVSAEYNASLARMIWAPKPFDGNGPDLRMNVAFIPHWTLSTADPTYEGVSGYFVGANFEHVMTSWLSALYSVFGESRDETMRNIDASPEYGRATTYNATLGLALHTDWQSQDRMVLGYSRYFYSDFTDSNPARPLDRDVFTLGASIAF